MPTTDTDPPLDTPSLVDNPADNDAEPPSIPEPADSDNAPPSDLPEPAERVTLPAAPDELSPELINTEPDTPADVSPVDTKTEPDPDSELLDDVDDDDIDPIVRTYTEPLPPETLLAEQTGCDA